MSDRLLSEAIRDGEYIDELEQKLAACREVLRRVEWSGMIWGDDAGGFVLACPKCSVPFRWADGKCVSVHEPDCALDACLQETT